jgi:gas vesicle protein
MSFSRSKSASLIGALAVAGLLLTGCAGGQSKADACKSLESGLQDVQSDLSSSLSGAETDPKGAADKLQSVSDTFSKNVKGVTNDEVAPAAKKADDALSALVSEFSKFAEDPTSADSSAMSSAASDVQSTFTDLGKVCS